MSRAWNFCAGPAALPEDVLQQAREEMLDYQGRGLSVMEMSHRSAEFVAIASQAEQDLRDLLAIPDEYAVLFCHGAHESAGRKPHGGLYQYWTMVEEGHQGSKALC